MKALKSVLFAIILAFTFQMNAQSVCITKTGDKYHTNSCSYLKYSKKQIALKDAIALGYKSCKVCKPNHSTTNSKGSSLQNNTVSKSTAAPAKKTTATQCAGKTKAGARCKRRTKNASGRCYQH